MESNWDKLVTVQSRLNYLENKRMRIISARCDQIRKTGGGPDPSYTDQMLALATELKELWAEKRYLLSQLDVPEQWSWISPVITSLTVSQGPLQISRKGPADSQSP